MALYPAGPVASSVSIHLEDQLTNRLSIASPPPLDSQWQAALAEFSTGGVEALLFGGSVAGAWSRSARVAPASQVWAAGSLPKPVPQDDFFERIIVIPRSINAGIVLGTVSFTIDIYNAYKVEPRSFDNFLNNVGQGVVITNLPALPTTIEEQDGIVLNLDILVEGPPFITGTLDFVFDTETVLIPVTGQRAIVFPFEPVEPVTESLLFLTDVVEKRDGKEQRISLREVPRQTISMRLELDGRDRRFAENLMASSQGLAFGVPVWWESTILTQPISPSDTVINVQETAYRDFRVGGLLIVLSDAFDFEALQIDSLTATTLTVSNPFTKAFAQGIRVMPMRTAFMQSSVEGSRRAVNLQETAVKFGVIDSTVDLSDDSAFPVFELKPILNEPNLMPGGALTENLTRKVTIVDSRTGDLAVFTEQAMSRRRHNKGFLTASMQRLWEVRGLMHALRGRQRSFWIPSFYQDFTPLASITSGSDVINVVNVGYNRFVKQQRPRDAIQIRKTDGTIVSRLIVNSNEVSEDEEQLQVDSAWGINATPGEMELVTIVEKVRLDKDEVDFKHFSQPGLTEISAALVSVFD